MHGQRQLACAKSRKSINYVLRMTQDVKFSGRGDFQCNLCFPTPRISCIAARWFLVLCTPSQNSPTRPINPLLGSPSAVASFSSDEYMILVYAWPGSTPLSLQRKSGHATRISQGRTFAPGGRAATPPSVLCAILTRLDLWQQVACEVEQTP